MSEKRRPEILLISATGFFIKLATTYSLILGYSLFLKTAGAGAMPYYYITLNFFASLTGIVFAVGNFDGMKLPYFLGPALGLAFSWLAGAGPAPASAGIFAVYVAASILDIYSWIFFLNYVNNSLSVRQAKRWIGFIAGVSAVGGIVAGFLNRLVLVRFTISGSYFLCALFLFTFPAVIFAFRVAPLREPSRAVSAADLAAAGKKIASSPLAIMIMTIFAASSFIRYVLGFEFSSGLAAFTGDLNDTASFVGVFESSLRLVVFAAQVLYAGRLLNSYALPSLLFVYQAFIASFAAAAYFSGTFFALASFQFYFLTAVKVVEQNVVNTLFNVFGTSFKSRARFLVEGTFYPAVTALVGTFIACFAALRPSGFFLVSIMAASAGYMFALRYLGPAYASEIGRSLREAGEPPPASPATGAPGDALEEGAIYASADPDADAADNISAGPRGALALRLSTLAELARSGDEAAGRTLGELIASEKDPRVLAAAVRISEKPGFDGFRERLAGYFQKISDERLLANALEAVASGSGPGRAGFVFGFIGHRGNRVRANAILATIRASRERPILEAAVGALGDMARSDSPAFRASAAAVMGELSLHCFAEAIGEMLSDASGEVRAAAARACGKIGSESLVPAIEAALARRGDPALAEHLKRALETIGSSRHAAYSRILNGFGLSERSRVIGALRKAGIPAPPRQLLAALAMCGGAAAAEIAESYCAGPSAERLAVLESAFAGSAPAASPLVARIVEGNAGAGFASDLLKTIARAAPQAVVAALSDFLVQNAAAGRAIKAETSAELAGIVGIACMEPEKAVTIFENLLCGDQAKRDLASELADSLADRPAAEVLKSLSEMSERRAGLS